MRSSLLCLDRISKSYPGQGPKRESVLSGFSLDIRPGESLGLFGPSGSGKSTIAKIILGVEPPDSGQVFFQGRMVSNRKIRPDRLFYRNVQMVWQDPFVYMNPFVSIRTSIIEPMAAFGIGTTRERRYRADMLMEAMGIPLSLGRCRPDRLSGGQCQRAAIARALGVSPRLLICDEALAGLDLVLQVDIIEHLIFIQKKFDMALLFISHDRGCTARMCSRIITLTLCPRAQGPPQEDSRNE